MKQAYRNFDFKGQTLETIHLINRIITTYLSQGYKLSVRQLYYQLVARALIENTERSYKRIASVINDGRLAGLIDWDAIEDRNRDIEMRTRWGSGAQIVDASARSFHMDMWDSQDYRVFVIVEKAALAGVLERTCRENDVPLLAARGYPSVSIVREMVLGHFWGPAESGQRIVVLHLGDHDPSGIDMTRDLSERIELFAEEHAEAIEVRRIALTMAQVDEKRPPPNPAKTTDARFAGYLREFGHESWELDALEPAYLVDLVLGEIDDLRDPDRWAIREQEVELIRDELTETARTFRKKGV